MRLILFFFLGTILLSSCATVGYHDSAIYDQEVSASLIKKLKIDTLLVAYSTYHDKERILRSSINKYPKNKNKLLRDLAELKTQQEVELQFIKKAFSQEFTFCPYLLIPDSLVHSFENGNEGPFFVGNGNSLDPEIIYSNHEPIKLLHRNETRWDLRIGEDLLPNPFPNYISYRNGLLELLGIQDFGDVVTNIARALNIRLEKFYNNPTRSVRY